MKKFGVITTLACGLILISGCTKTNTPTNGSSDVLAVYNEAHEMTCNLTYTAEGEAGTSTIYIKDGVMKQETTAEFEGDEYTIYTLAKDGTMYMRGDMYGDMAGFKTTYDFDVEKELAIFDEEDGTTISCVKGVKNNSVFNLPNDIEFTSMDELYDLDVDLGVEDTDSDELNENDETSVENTGDENEGVETVEENNDDTIQETIEE